MTLVLALALSLATGISLGMLGGGGSILTVPILLYALELAPKQAIATSLVVVGVTSAAALIPHARAGRVHLRTALPFGAAGMVGAYLGARVAHYLPSSILLVGFGVMMLVTARAMMRGRSSQFVGSQHSAGAGGQAIRELPIARVLLHGLGVGGVAGLVGAGGGFLVVPALVLLGGLPMRTAVGTSLLVIAMQSLAGALGYLGHVAIDWPLTAMLSSSAVMGSLLGARLASSVSQERLRRGFAWFVVAMGAFMLARQLPTALGVEPAFGTFVNLERFTPLASTLGGVLIGLSASLLLLGVGRIAGVSGIFAGLLVRKPGDVAWRFAFVLGLVLGGLGVVAVMPEVFSSELERAPATVATAGLLVGFGTRMGSGCTSGHGVCGLGRLSARSLVATLTFMATAALTVFVAQHFLRGSS